MTEKIVGYSLLTVGILVVVFCALNVLFVFTGQALPVQLFHFQNVSLDMGQMLGVKSQNVDLINAAELNLISNLSAHIFLMGFLVSAGFKLATLGTQLVRPIVLKTKDDKTALSNS